mgnify:CR=1 FL=1
MRTWLKDLRISAGKTMKEMAVELGISESYYCSVENGDRQKRMDTAFIVGLANALEMDPSEILNREIEYMTVQTEGV